MYLSSVVKKKSLSLDKNMIIRAGKEIDLARILQIEKRAFPNSAWSKEMIHNELLEKSDRKTWVIESKKELIGYCMIQFGPEEVHLINMAVEPLFQNMGLGRKLLHHFLDTNAPNTSIFLEVKRGNFSAINLYLNAGFEEITIRKKYYTEGEDAIIMCLKV